MAKKVQSIPALVMFGRHETNGTWSPLGFANDVEFAQTEASVFFDEEDVDTIRLVSVSEDGVGHVVTEFRPAPDYVDGPWPLIYVAPRR